MTQPTLPAEVIERIEKEAKLQAFENYVHRSETKVVFYDFETWSFAAKVSYYTAKRILTSQAIRALPLVEALERSISIIDSECDDESLVAELRQVINNYKQG